MSPAPDVDNVRRTSMTAVSILLLIIAISLPVFWGSHRNTRMMEHFTRVNNGMSEEVVLRLMGKPSWIDEPCGKSFGGSQPECEREYFYRNSFAPVLPEYWSVRFDKAGRVMDTYSWESP